MMVLKFFGMNRMLDPNKVKTVYADNSVDYESGWHGMIFDYGEKRSSDSYSVFIEHNEHFTRHDPNMDFQIRISIPKHAKERAARDFKVPPKYRSKVDKTYNTEYSRLFEHAKQEAVKFAQGLADYIVEHLAENKSMCDLENIPDDHPIVILRNRYNNLDKQSAVSMKEVILRTVPLREHSEKMLKAIESYTKNR